MTNSNAGTPGGEKQRASRPRRRGRRRRGSGQGTDTPQEQNETRQEQPRQERSARQEQPKQDRAAQQAQPPRGEKSGRGRRRGNRRPRPADAGTGEVLRGGGERMAPVQPMRKRPLSAEGDTSEPEFGCPMLTRTRLGLPFRGGQNVPRCSMGWAVHDEDEVLFCMHTPARELCWKENPEQLEQLIEKLRPQIEAELAGKDSAAD